MSGREDPSEEPSHKTWKPVALLAAGVLLAAAVLVSLFLSTRPHRHSPLHPSPRKPASLPVPAVGLAPAANVPVATPPTPRQISWEGLSVKPYRGKFQGEYPIQKATSALERDLMDAIKDLKDNFGLFPTAADRVVFEPRDTSECAFKGPYGIEAGAAGGPMRVDIPMEPLVLGWYPARRVMAAALAEAVLTREAPGYASAPPWLRHGLALHLSRFGEFVERRYLLQSADSPLHKVRALEEAGDDSWTAGYWALRSLAGRRGDAGVKALADALRQKADWREALRSAGETPEQMDSTYRTWAKAHLRDITANREEFLDMVGLLRREREKEVLPRFEAFTREHPLDLYAGDSRYYHAYALYRTGAYDLAVRAFTDLLFNDPTSTSMQGKAHFFLGRCYQILNYPPLAEEQYLLARADPGSALLAQLATARLEEVR